MRNYARNLKLSCFLFVLVALFPALGRATNLTVDCSGGTPGAFTRLQAAIDSLDLLGPHRITVVGAPCIENVQIVDRQRLTIIAPQGNFITSQLGPNGDVMTISGSTGITLILLGFTGGSRGLVINRASEVSIHGTTVQGNAAAGIRIDGNSTVDFDGAIQNNGGAGINANDSSLILGGGTQLLNNGAAGVALTRSRGKFQGNTFQGNRTGLNITNGSSATFLPTSVPNLIQNNRNAGVNVSNGSSAVIFAPTLIQNNGSIGVQVADGSSVRFFGDVAPDGTPVPNVISGNPFIGLNIDNGAVIMFDANYILNNGLGMQQFHAGVRVDDNASLIAVGSDDIQIKGNSGPGIDATTGGNVDLTGTVVSNNSEDGIRLQGNAQVAFFPPNTNVLAGNGGQPIKCDNTSVFFGDRTGLQEFACKISELKDRPSASERKRMMKEERDDK